MLPPLQPLLANRMCFFFLLLEHRMPVKQNAVNDNFMNFQAKYSAHSYCIFCHADLKNLNGVAPHFFCMIHGGVGILD